MGHGWPMSNICWAYVGPMLGHAGHVGAMLGDLGFFGGALGKSLGEGQAPQQEKLLLTGFVMPIWALCWAYVGSTCHTVGVMLGAIQQRRNAIVSVRLGN